MDIEKSKLILLFITFYLMQHINFFTKFEFLERKGLRRKGGGYIRISKIGCIITKL
jgi:transcriptional regulator CtsR